MNSSNTVQLWRLGFQWFTGCDGIKNTIYLFAFRAFVLVFLLLLLSLGCFLTTNLILVLGLWITTLLPCILSLTRRFLRHKEEERERVAITKKVRKTMEDRNRSALRKHKTAVEVDSASEDDGY